MVLNPDKCHFTILCFQDQSFDFHYENVVIRNSAEEKILGITIGNKLNFKAHIINFCTVAYQKLSALCKVSNYIDSDKCKLLVNSFVKSQISYCPLIWMFCTRESNYSLNRVHERALRIISENYASSFSELVTLLNEKIIHQRCINFFMTEVFRYLNVRSCHFVSFLRGF